MDDAESYWTPLFKVVWQHRCWVRIAWPDDAPAKESPWGQLLLMPTQGYLEGPGGPVPLQDVEWVDVSTRILKRGGAGLPLQRIDISKEILTGLRETQLSWELRESSWSVGDLFENEPMQVVRFVNPFFKPRPAT